MHLFFLGLGMMLVIEGLLPFLLPDRWRRLMLEAVSQQNKTLRLFGLISMIIGLGLLYFFKN